MNQSRTFRVDELSLQPLLTFCRVYELQSYSAAARELELSVPTAWEQVRSLQQRYGVAFFEKKGRGIETTPAGTQLYRSLQPILAGLESTFEVVGLQGNSPNQPITLVVGVRMMQEELASVLQSFQREFPMSRLRILHRDNVTAQELVASGGADLALMLRPGPGGLHDKLVSQVAHAVDYLAVAPRRHPLVRRNRWRLDEIVAHPLIIGHQGTNVRQLFEQALHRRNLYDRMQVSVETDNSAFTLATVRANMGIGIVAGIPDGPLCRGLKSVSLGEELGEAQIACLWKRGRQLTPALKQLVELLGQAGSSI